MVQQTEVSVKRILTTVGMVLVLAGSLSWVLQYLRSSHEEGLLHQAAPRITKQVEIVGVEPAPIHFIRSFADGDLLIGGGPTGWVARVSQTGIAKWTFEVDPTGMRGAREVIITGAAITSSGNIVACGSDSENRTEKGLIVTLNSDGEKLSSRTVEFNGSISLNSCEGFNDKVIVTGNKFPPQDLILMLDDTGSEIWHRIGPVGTFLDPQVIETSDGAVNALEYASASTQVFKFDSSGRILSQVAVAGTLPFALVNPDLRSSISLIAYSGTPALFQIDENNYVSRVQLSNDVGVTVSGSSYLLPDGSVAVFGHGLRENNIAAAARVLRDGEIALTEIGPDRQAWSLGETIRISPYEFISTESVSRSPHGVDMLVWLDYPVLENQKKFATEVKAQ